MTLKTLPCLSQPRRVWSISRSSFALSFCSRLCPFHQFLWFNLLVQLVPFLSNITGAHSLLSTLFYFFSFPWVSGADVHQRNAWRFWHRWSPTVRSMKPIEQNVPPFISLVWIILCVIYILLCCGQVPKTKNLRLEGFKFAHSLKVMVRFYALSNWQRRVSIPRKGRCIFISFRFSFLQLSCLM